MKIWNNKKYIFLFIGGICFYMLLSTFKDVEKPDFLMESTRYETPIHYLDNSSRKTKIFIVAGIHGHEIAGIEASKKIIEEKYPWAKMTILPIANQEAYGLKVRNPYYMSDLNRAFPGRENGTDTEKLAQEIFKAIKREKPDFVIDLHEWGRKYDEDPSLLVNALILNSVDGKLWKVAEKVYNEYNNLGKEDKLILAMGAPSGTINKEVSERLHIPVITVESNIENSLEDRVNFQLYIIENIIKNYEMD